MTRQFGMRTQFVVRDKKIEFIGLNPKTTTWSFLSPPPMIIMEMDLTYPE